MFPARHVHDPDSIAGRLAVARARLERAGCSTPRLDAELLLSECLGRGREWLLAHPDQPLDGKAGRRYADLIQRRAGREPVAYIRGRREFWSLEISVDRRVLVPRPESETIIEAARQLFEHNEHFFLADIGTGSGCLAAALAVEFPNSHGLACDTSAEALAVAAHNLRRLGLSGRVECEPGDLLDPVAPGRCRLIVCNPPYIPSAELDCLGREVRIHEPRLALDGGPDGLVVIRRLVAAAPARLEPGGWFLCEVGPGQAGPVAGLCRESGFAATRTFADLGGVERVVAARWACKR